MNKFFPLLFFIPLYLFSIASYGQTSTPVKNYSNEIAIRWNQEFLAIERYAIGYRPCPTPRALAYLGLSAYEACVKGMSGYNSIASTMPGLSVPQSDAALEYHWPTVVNASYHYLMVRFFASSNPTYITGIEQLNTNFNATLSSQTSSVVFQRSVQHGEAVAAAVWAFAATDAVGHNAHLNPSGNYQWQDHVTGPSSYVATEASIPQPVFSYFGGARRFAISEAEKLCAPPSIPYSEAPLSPFRLQAEEVVIRSNANQSYEDKWIAEFWSDDMTNTTFSPPARLISIANQVIKKSGSNLETALYTYAKIGLSLNDAAVSCWYSKYYYNLLRPVTYIQRVIDQSWVPTLTNPITNLSGYTPSFPAYPSGHSTFASAGCKVLSDIFGENFTLTDSSHYGRTEFVGTPRTFTNFTDMAAENAYSRIPLGVHYRIDCDEGLALGYRVANKVNAMPWKSAPNTPNCDAITFTASGNSISIGNLAAPNIGIQVFNASWQSMYTCTGNTCQKPTTTVPNLPAGNYFVKVTYYSTTWSKTCEKSQYIAVSGGSGNNSVITFQPVTNITVTANQGATSHPVSFSTPVATTTCPGGVIAYQQVSGLPTGSAFPIGTSTVVFAASDNCANSKTVSMSVTVNAQNVGPLDCASIAISSSGSSILVNNISTAAPLTYVKILNSGGQEVYKCVGNCASGAVTVPNLPNGGYNVKVRLMQANFSIICEVNRSIVVNSGGNTGSPCDNLTIVPEANTIKISGLASTRNWGIQVFNASWTKVFSCAGNTCILPTTTIPNLVPGVYYVKINCYTSTYAVDCKKDQQVTIAAPALASSAAVNFSALKQGKTVNLTWETLTPATKNLDYFVVERSADNTTFEPIQSITDGISLDPEQSFATTDPQPLPQDNYYRLRVIFTDGTELQAPVQLISYHTPASLLVFPNPTSGEFMIEMDNFAGQSATIAIYNLLGKEVFRQEATDTSGGPLLIANHNLGEGIYQIAVTSAKGVRALGRVVISK